MRRTLVALNLLSVLGEAATAVAITVAPQLFYPQAVVTHELHVFAAYFAIRNVATAIAVVALIALRKDRMLAALLLMMGGIQVADVALAVIAGTPQTSGGPLVAAVIHLAGAWWFSRERPVPVT